MPKASRNIGGLDPMPRPHEVVMPELDLGTFGVGDEPPVVGQWLVRRGAQVFRGESLLEIVAGCVLVELPAPASGRLSEQLCGQDDPLLPGQVLGLIVEEDERFGPGSS
jgi:pyruvate/2-oxoglutarate dehydrogenase complex dihydrolipoamide acyltransferase (E2) component